MTRVVILTLRFKWFGVGVSKGTENISNGYMATWLHGYMVTWLHGYMVTWLNGYMVTWLHGYMVRWLNGYMVSQALGLTGVGYIGDEPETNMDNI